MTAAGQPKQGIAVDRNLDISGRRRARPNVSRSYRGAVIAGLALLAGCGSGPLPPVFNAVFGLEDAESVPFRSGKLPDPMAGPGDRVLGLAANSPGQCVYQRANRQQRFISSCPEGYGV